MSYRVTATWTAPAEPGTYTSQWDNTIPRPQVTYAEIITTVARRDDAEQIAQRTRNARPGVLVEVTNTDEHHRTHHQRNPAADQAMAQALANLRAG